MKHPGDRLVTDIGRAARPVVLKTTPVQYRTESCQSRMNPAPVTTANETAAVPGAPVVPDQEEQDEGGGGELPRRPARPARRAASAARVQAVHRHQGHQHDVDLTEAQRGAHRFQPDSAIGSSHHHPSRDDRERPNTRSTTHVNAMLASVSARPGDGHRHPGQRREQHRGRRRVAERQPASAVRVLGSAPYRSPPCQPGQAADPVDVQVEAVTGSSRSHDARRDQVRRDQGNGNRDERQAALHGTGLRNGRVTPGEQRAYAVLMPPGVDTEIAEGRRRCGCWWPRTSG